MTDRALRRQLRKASLEIARILNLVVDDDERDDLHGLVERTINDELFEGSRIRNERANVVPIRRGHALGDVIDIFSRRVPKETA